MYCALTVIVTDIYWTINNVYFKQSLIRQDYFWGVNVMARNVQICYGPKLLHFQLLYRNESASGTLTSKYMCV